MEEIPAWARSSGSLADNAYGRTLGEYREPFSKCFVLIFMCVSIMYKSTGSCLSYKLHVIAIQNTDCSSFKGKDVFGFEEKYL